MEKLGEAMRSSEYWWQRAEEACAQVNQLTNEDAKRAMRAMVEIYERIARITEEAEAKLAGIKKKDAKGF